MRNLSPSSTEYSKAVKGMTAYGISDQLVRRVFGKKGPSAPLDAFIEPDQQAAFSDLAKHGMFMEDPFLGIRDAETDTLDLPVEIEVATDMTPIHAVLQASQDYATAATPALTARNAYWSARRALSYTYIGGVGWEIYEAFADQPNIYAAAAALTAFAGLRKVLRPKYHDLAQYGLAATVSSYIDRSNLACVRLSTPNYMAERQADDPNDITCRLYAILKHPGYETNKDRVESLHPAAMAVIEIDKTITWIDEQLQAVVESETYFGQPDTLSARRTELLEKRAHCSEGYLEIIAGLRKVEHLLDRLHDIEKNRELYDQLDAVLTSLVEIDAKTYPQPTVVDEMKLEAHRRFIEAQENGLTVPQATDVAQKIVARVTEIATHCITPEQRDAALKRLNQELGVLLSLSEELPIENIINEHPAGEASPETYGSFPTLFKNAMQRWSRNLTSS